MASAKQTAVAGEGLQRVQGGQGAGSVGKPYSDECAMHPERGEVVDDGQGAIDYVRRGDDQVECMRQGLGEILHNCVSIVAACVR